MQEHEPLPETPAASRVSGLSESETIQSAATEATTNVSTVATPDESKTIQRGVGEGALLVGGSFILFVGASAMGIGGVIGHFSQYEKLQHYGFVSMYAYAAASAITGAIGHTIGLTTALKK
jgi:hypothetical protein